MIELGKKDVMSILVEGGSEIFADFITNKLVDHVVACVAPKFIGGEGKDMLPGLSISSITDVRNLKEVTFRNFDDDMVIEGSLL
jgi:diaminohydroxyphosphoribosylaminopyrimidine deaminase/5-amino-6-(5-phosphoribosylamino)uracil reductase